MARSRSLLALLLLLVTACSTARTAAPPPPADPATEPTVAGAVDEAILQGTIEGDAASQTSRRVGRVLGVIAAVAGGPQTESVDDVVDRYRRVRDATEATGVLIATTKGAVEGAKRGYELDLQFAELQRIEGLEVTRPFPDQIDARFLDDATPAMLAEIAAVFAGQEERSIELEGPTGAACDIRASLAELGLDPYSLSAVENERLDAVVMHVRYRS
ncbi:MAG TPA: hypothetical protein VGF28_25530 [Thermoanaerobaculia bacterium]